MVTVSSIRSTIARKVYMLAYAIQGDSTQQQESQKESPARESYVMKFRLWRNRRKANRTNRWPRRLRVWWMFQYYAGVVGRMAAYLFGIMLAYTIAYMGICVILGVVLGVVNVISA